MAGEPKACDPLHSRWARAFLAWDEAELDRLEAELDAACQHQQKQHT